MIPEGHTIEDIKKREQIIRDFYREWKEKNPSQRKYNLSLKEYINIRMVSIVETSEHAAKSYLSTLAVLQLDSILTGARKVSVKKPKPGNANQKPFERIMIMEYELTGIGKIKMIYKDIQFFCNCNPVYVIVNIGLDTDKLSAGTFCDTALSI